MKLLEVLQRLSKGEIKDGTVLTIKDNIGGIYQYKCVDNCFLNDYHLPLNVYSGKDLNREVSLIEPKPKKYHLRLYKDSNVSYINCNQEEYFVFSLGNKYGSLNEQTTFTQKEIDNNMLLKFIESHGIKEEVNE